MEAGTIDTLTPVLQSADQWSEILLLLPLLVALEAVLSADNAIALAAISRRLHDRSRQETALNLGLLLALVFRIALILAARWVLNFWPLQLAASAYLLWLCGRHLVLVFNGREEGLEADAGSLDAGSASAGLPHPPGHPHEHLTVGLGSVIATLALTDLAFSIDSVAAAVAVSDRIGLVIAGGVIGVIALRLTAELFIRWLEVFRHLETAGYLAVGLVGVRLLLRLGLPDLVPPEWLLLAMVASLFLWGFSTRNPAPGVANPTLAEAD
jgi:YkoY family integral membrane protein